MDDPESISEAVTSTCNRSSSGELPTLEYVTKSGARRQESYERDRGAPWRVIRVERERRDGEWREVGVETLRELRVDGECRTAVSLGGER